MGRHGVRLGLAGDLWSLLNPWAIIHTWLRRDRSQDSICPYPRALGHWPALLLFLGFAWLELISELGEQPRNLGWLIVAYSGITWTGMYVYRRDAWLGHGEVFAVVFGLLARFAPGAAVGGCWFLRYPAVGLLCRRPLSLSRVCLVLLLPTVFISVYMLTAWLIARCGRATQGTLEVAGYFVLTLVPIAIAYHLSHYLSYLLIAGQYVIPQGSDPFGRGWDLFGTAGYTVDIGIVNARMVWYTAVGAIVIGHVAAVYIAHVMALRVFADRARALWSQAPMLVLMVGYTMISLWILSQPIVS